MKRSISGRNNTKAPGMEDRAPMLAEITEVYGPEFAAVAARYIDFDGVHPHEEYVQPDRGVTRGSGVADGSLPPGFSRWVKAQP